MTKPTQRTLIDDYVQTVIIPRHLWMPESFNVHTSQFNIESFCALHNGAIQAISSEFINLINNPPIP
jgi:hypothetical protein